MKIFNLLRAISYGFSAAIVFVALLYATDVGGVREYFGQVPNPSGILIVLGGLSMAFVGLGMLLARMTGNKHDF